MNHSNLLVLGLLAVTAGGCLKTSTVLSTQDGGESTGVVSSRDGGADRSHGGPPLTTPTPVDPRACERDGVCIEVPVSTIDKVDLLFAIDNSETMGEEQRLLAASFPQLLRTLTSGDRDGDGIAEFPGAKDIHLGVVSGDLGNGGEQGFEGCAGFGDDAVLQSERRLTNCKSSYPPFLTFNTGLDSALDVAEDLACVSTLGTSGCGFSQPLESALKALWPSADSRVVFVSTDQGTTRGRGDRENSGFDRFDEAFGVSVLAVVVVSDDDDCSSSNINHLFPAELLDPSAPERAELEQQGMNVRCALHEENLFATHRYSSALKTLRPGREDLVVFAALVGVPPENVDRDALSRVDFDDSEARAEFYDGILNQERMKKVVVDEGTADVEDDHLRPACESAHGPATPGRRIVDVAKRFGRNGVVQSICEDDYAPAMNAIVDRIAPKLGMSCLELELARQSDGRVSCDVIWELPPSADAPQGTPTRCDDPQRTFLAPVGKKAMQRTAQGGARCLVSQLAVRAQGGGTLGPIPTTIAGETAFDGWYYDDFSEDAQRQCRQGDDRFIAFTPEAKPPTGVRVVLDCDPDASR